MSEFLTPYMTLLIVAAAAATYLTRIGGYLLIARLKTVPPRLERAERRSGGRADDARRARLLYRGTDVKVAMAVALAVGLRFSAIPLLVSGWIAVMAMRYFIG